MHVLLPGKAAPDTINVIVSVGGARADCAAPCGDKPRSDSIDAIYEQQQHSARSQRSRPRRQPKKSRGRTQQQQTAPEQPQGKSFMVCSCPADSLSSHSDPAQHCLAPNIDVLCRLTCPGMEASPVFPHQQSRYMYLIIPLLEGSVCVMEVAEKTLCLCRAR